MQAKRHRVAFKPLVDIEFGILCDAIGAVAMAINYAGKKELLDIFYKKKYYIYGPHRVCEWSRFAEPRQQMDLTNGTIIEFKVKMEY